MGSATPHRERRTQQGREAEIEFGRIVAFSDGVFAIAITLLVLALEVPSSAGDLGSALLNQEDELFAYAISFAVLGKFWLAHHRFFGSLDRFDNRLMGLNLFYLAWIALVPYTSELLGDYSGETDAVVAYALNMVGVTLAFNAQIVYAYRHGLIKPEYEEQKRRFAGPANLVVAAIFLASIPIAIVNPTAATLVWLLSFFAGRWLGDRAAGMKAPV